MNRSRRTANLIAFLVSIVTVAVLIGVFWWISGGIGEDFLWWIGFIPIAAAGFTGGLFVHKQDMVKIAAIVFLIVMFGIMVAGGVSWGITADITAIFVVLFAPVVAFCFIAGAGIGTGMGQVIWRDEVAQT
ncbi:MAG: hypothetical protein ACXABK_07000 [Candidatus Heimdallarchaeaceae archaeon]|jgi:hypothetical protein